MDIKMKKIISLLLLFSFMTFSIYTSVAATKSKKNTSINNSYINFESFEKALSSFWCREMANNTYSGAISTKYAQKSKHSFRIELRKDDPIVCGSKRSEISTMKPEQPLEEHTYTFGVFLPKGGSEDFTNDPEGDDIIAQWHNTPDPGEEWTYPPVALHIQGDGHYYLWNIWDEDPLSTDEKMQSEGKLAYYDLGSYLNDKGKWITWKFHIKWGWLASQKPILEVYKNGVKLLDLQGLPNTTNDQKGVYMKLGIYKWEWSQPADIDKSILTKRIVYYDNISIK